mmetsp:Transcript_41674/g.126142  ORF Transcript_41674/g.126142 Transcript_41674/m.126142 type:complete len:257 (+) Transcript_41674:214-984(+)
MPPCSSRTRSSSTPAAASASSSASPGSSRTSCSTRPTPSSSARTCSARSFSATASAYLASTTRSSAMLSWSPPSRNLSAPTQPGWRRTSCTSFPRRPCASSCVPRCRRAAPSRPRRCSWSSSRAWPSPRCARRRLRGRGRPSWATTASRCALRTSGSCSRIPASVTSTPRAGAALLESRSTLRRPGGPTATTSTTTSSTRSQRSPSSCWSSRASPRTTRLQSSAGALRGARWACRTLRRASGAASSRGTCPWVRTS